MADKSILEELFNEKILKILKLFIYNPEEEYYVREIAKRTRVPLASSHRILQKLVKAGILKEIRIKHYRAYRLADSKDTKFLESILTTARSAIKEFVDMASKIEGIDQIIQHGKETKDKVSILIIGRNINTEAVKQLVGQIKATFNFTIIQLMLEPEQFQQMSEMGLYPSQRITLFTR
ncbi:winged helix-turn-helix transcriptional regulator [Candidatus Woesearchaeota archaeon]|nr:winged helix-turn-helix transcriptional regulator [Candidatus Woesearchaeota archaeon]